MPVKRRLSKTRDDYPRPWEDRPVSFERWERHRERILAQTRAGRRPEEWWEYEATIPWPGYDDETVALYKAGLLDDEELAELMPWWREQYDRSHEPDFGYCGGPGKFLKGDEARKAHYRWAQIPPEIVKRWDQESAARAKTIKKLGTGQQ
jgi:hypothetical protein